MRVDFYSEARPGTPKAVVEIDPTRVIGVRSPFGPLLQIFIQVIYEQGKDLPLMFEGMLCWPSQHVGLHIPLQTVGRGTATLVVPISDHEITSLEQRRAGGELRLELDLRAIGFPDEPGVLGRYTPSGGRIALEIPRDKWKAVLDGFGVGIVRILELPNPPKPDKLLKEAADQLELAARSFSEGRYGESIAAARVCVERMIDSIGARVGLPRGDKSFAPFVEALAEKLKNRRVGNDPLALIGSLIRALFGWTSHPVHRGFQVSERDDALFALNLCVGLYSYIVSATGWENLHEQATTT
ncbi:MAG: hypothetical protein ABR949_05735 [Candidatus Aquilonibacter sp.]|jgi:hypothetical protein